MAHADYRMKGPCSLCARVMFVGVCPHGMAERVWPESELKLGEDDKNVFVELLRILQSGDKDAMDEYLIRQQVKSEWAEGK